MQCLGLIPSRILSIKIYSIFQPKMLWKLYCNVLLPNTNCTQKQRGLFKLHSCFVTFCIWSWANLWIYRNSNLSFDISIAYCIELYHFWQNSYETNSFIHHINDIKSFMSVGIFSVFQTKHFIAQKCCTTGSYKVSFFGNIVRLCVSPNIESCK